MNDRPRCMETDTHRTMPQPVTVSGKDLLRWRREQLLDGGASTELDWLLDAGAGLSWGQLQALRLDPQRRVELRQSLDQLTLLWQRYQQKQQSLQYLVGRCWWRGFDLSVGPGVLIPRQETELLVDVACQLMADRPMGPQLWADLGCGTGCLALGLAAAFPRSRGFAVEQDLQALTFAARNLEGVSDQVEVLAGSWWQPLAPWVGHLDLVVSNPPYIPTATVERLDPLVRDHEPRGALDGGADGLDGFRALLNGIATLTPGGWLVVEHMQGQASALEQLFAAAGLEGLEHHPDIEGNDRFLAGHTRRVK